jgi:quinoprotein glucose dehydrogenase
MNTGDIVWQVANGDTYEWIKNHPALKGVNVPENRARRTRAASSSRKHSHLPGRAAVCSEAAAAAVRRSRPYDKMTGAVVHELQLPANTCGNPMTYMVNGKQFIVVAVGAQNFPAELVALALP